MTNASPKLSEVPKMQVMMDFPDALRECCLGGKKVRRVSWPVEEWSYTNGAHLMIHRNGDHTWIVQDGDYLAEDWVTI